LGAAAVTGHAVAVVALLAGADEPVAADEERPALIDQRLDGEPWVMQRNRVEGLQELLGRHARVPVRNRRPRDRRRCVPLRVAHGADAGGLWTRPSDHARTDPLEMTPPR